MLTLYRRHLSKCDHAKGSKKRGTAADEKSSCKCPIWMQGTHDGQSMRYSLDVTSWTKAEKLKRDIEDGVKPKLEGITVADALDKFIADCKARNLNRSTFGKYDRLAKALKEFCERNGYRLLPDLSTDILRKFREAWTLAPRTAGKQLEHLRQIFKFAVESGWLSVNPAKPIKVPKVRVNPRIPFEEEDVQKLLSRAKDDRELAFLLTLRHTGLRIGDASLLRVSQLEGNRVHLYTTKADKPVSVLIPESLASLLQAIKPRGGYFFVRGDSISMHTCSDLWRRRFKIICKEAAVSPDHPHRMRHTLAKDLLSKGASVEDVAAILGNTPLIVQKHYAQWVKARQTRLDDIIQSTWEQPKLVRVK